MTASTHLAATWVRGWWHVAFAVTNLWTAVGAATLVVLMATGVALLPAAGAGIVLVVPVLFLGLAIGVAERTRIAALLGVTVLPPPQQDNPTIWRSVAMDQRKYKAMLWLLVHTIWGTVSGAVTATLVALAATFGTSPLWFDREPEPGAPWILWLFDAPGAHVVLPALSVVVFVTAPWWCRLFTMVDVSLAQGLLGRSARVQIDELSSNVERLKVSRSETVDSVEAERQRIERDLHDGPQQRLVSIALDIAMARDALRDDPDFSEELLTKAHGEAKEAMEQMRAVARGIVPPILTDRGLDAAVSALAAKSSVPVRVSVDAPRLPKQVETIAYYVTSEALTNVLKHADATEVRIDITTERLPTGQVLRVHVIDNGRGGADPSGSGLRGLRQRLQAIDGTLDVASPPGGPTIISAHLWTERTKT